MHIKTLAAVFSLPAILALIYGTTVFGATQVFKRLDNGLISPFKIKEIPDGFIISRYFLDPTYSKEELAIALSIAMGHHGFGSKFNKDNPFIIAPIELLVNDRPSLALEELEAEAHEVAAKFGDKVIVEGFRQRK